MAKPINSKRLYLKIKEAYKNSNYLKVITKVEEYLNIPDIHTPIKLFYYYGVSLQETGELEQAYEAYTKVIESNPDSKLKLSIARRLNGTKYAIKAYELLKEATQDPEFKNDLAYYLLGKKELYQGNNEEALVNFYKSLEYTSNSFTKRKLIGVIKATHERIVYGMKTIDYNFYRLKGGSLQNGQIVYLKRGSIISTTNEQDTKKEERPYLIICQSGNDIIALPLTLQEIPNHYHNRISGTVAGFKSDRYIMSEPAAFTHNDVEFIIGQVGLSPYYPLIKHLYNWYYCSNPESLTDYQKLFLEKFNEQQTAKVHDTIKIYNYSLNRYETYFITSEDEEYYYVYPFAIENSTYKIIGESTSVPKSTLLLYINPIGDELINELLSQIESTTRK